MSYASRRALVPITLVFALALFVSACSPGSQEARAVGDSEIGLDMTSGGVHDHGREPCGTSAHPSGGRHQCQPLGTPAAPRPVHRQGFAAGNWR